MYGVLLLAALTTGSATPNWHGHGGGCDCGGYGSWGGYGDVSHPSTVVSGCYGVMGGYGYGGGYGDVSHPGTVVPGGYGVTGGTVVPGMGTSKNSANRS